MHIAGSFLKTCADNLPAASPFLFGYNNIIQGNAVSHFFWKTIDPSLPSSLDLSFNLLSRNVLKEHYVCLQTSVSFIKTHWKKHVLFFLYTSLVLPKISKISAYSTVFFDDKTFLLRKEDALLSKIRLIFPITAIAVTTYVSKYCFSLATSSLLKKRQAPWLTLAAYTSIYYFHMLIVASFINPIPREDVDTSHKGSLLNLADGLDHLLFSSNELSSKRNYQPTLNQDTAKITQLINVLITCVFIRSRNQNPFVRFSIIAPVSILISKIVNRCLFSHISRRV